MNRAAGVAVHVLINGTEYEAADEALQELRQQAFECCEDCAAEWFRRQGDLLVETRDPAKARFYLDVSAGLLGEDLDDDTRGRIVFVRGIAQLYLGRRDQALADIDDCLQLLSLTSSRGYFNDAVALPASSRAATPRPTTNSPSTSCGPFPRAPEGPEGFRRGPRPHPRYVSAAD